MARTPDSLTEIARTLADERGIPINLALATMKNESGGNPNAVSPTGAYGPMQLMPGTAAELGVDRHDPEQNIWGGVKYLDQNLQRFGGNQALASAAYNAGPGAVEKAGGIPQNNETPTYVSRVMRDAGVGGGEMAQAPVAQPAGPSPMQQFLRLEADRYAKRAQDQALNLHTQIAQVPDAPTTPGMFGGFAKDFASGVFDGGVTVLRAATETLPNAFTGEHSSTITDWQKQFDATRPDWLTPTPDAIKPSETFIDSFNPHKIMRGIGEALAPMAVTAGAALTVSAELPLGLAALGVSEGLSALAGTAGGLATAGGLGAAQFGSGTYEELKAQGKTDEEAAHGALESAAVGGMVSTLDVGQALRFLPMQAKTRLAHAAVTGGIDAVTMAAQQYFNDTVIAPDPSKDAIRNALDTLGPMGVMGFAFGFARGPHRAAEAPGPKPSEVGAPTPAEDHAKEVTAAQARMEAGIEGSAMPTVEPIDVEGAAQAERMKAIKDAVAGLPEAPVEVHIPTNGEEVVHSEEKGQETQVLGGGGAEDSSTAAAPLPTPLAHELLAPPASAPELPQQYQGDRGKSQLATEIVNQEGKAAGKPIVGPTRKARVTELLDNNTNEELYYQLNPEQRPQPAEELAQQLQARDNAMQVQAVVDGRVGLGQQAVAGAEVLPEQHAEAIASHHEALGQHGVVDIPQVEVTAPAVGNLPDVQSPQGTQLRLLSTTAREEADRQLAPIYYSHLRDMVEQKMGGSMDAGELAKMLKANGVKDEEMEWSRMEGLKGKVTKAEVLEHLGENAIDVQEVQNGGEGGLKVSPDLTEFLRSNNKSPQTSDEWGAIANRLEGIANQWRNTGDDAKAEEHWRLAEEAGMLRDGVNPETGSTAGMLKHAGNASLNVPGGTNHVELVLKVPDPSWMYPGRRDAPSQAALDKVFQTDSTHFGEVNNQLLWIRAAEHMDAEGKRVFFVNELQSKWAQEALDKADAAAEAAGLGKRSTLINGTPEKEAYSAFINDYMANSKFVEPGLPDAPYIDSTEKWVTLGIKRIIRYAAEHDYDRVAWTPGDVQNERYSLAKHYDSVSYNPETRGFTARDKQGTQVHTGTYSPEELPGVIGEELTKRLMDKVEERKGLTLESAGYEVRQLEDHAGNKIPQYELFKDGKLVRGQVGSSDPKEHDFIAHSRKSLENMISWIDPRFGSAKLTGLDLEVGGTGMKGFYDKILKDTANKLIKPFGGRVGLTNLAGEANAKALNARQVSRLEELRGRLFVPEGESGEPLTTVELEEYHQLADRENIAGTISSKAEAIATGRSPVMSFDLPDGLRDAALYRGQRLFASKGRNSEAHRNAELDTFRAELHKQGLKVRTDHDELLRDILNGKEAPQWLAARWLERSGEVTVGEYVTEKGTVGIHIQTASDLPADQKAAANLFAKYSQQVEGALARTQGRERIPPSLQANEVLAMSGKEVEARFRDLKNQGWVGEMMGRMQEMVAGVNQGAGRIAITKGELDRVAYLFFARAEAHAATSGGTSEDWYRSHFTKEAFGYARNLSEPVPGQRAPLSRGVLPTGTDIYKGRTGTADVTWLDGQRAFIRLTDSADFSSLLEEAIHVFRRDLGGADERNTIEAIRGITSKLTEADLIKKFNLKPTDAGYEDRLAALKADAQNPVVSKDGMTHWSALADETYADAVKQHIRGLNGKDLAAEGVPSVLQKTFGKAAKWLKSFMAWIVKAPVRPNSAIAQGFYRLFDPSSVIKGNASSKFVEARLQAKSGQYSINPSYFASSPEALDLLMQLNGANAEERKAGKTSFDQMRADAVKLIGDPTALEKIHEAVLAGRAPSAAEMTYLSVLNQHQIIGYVDLALKAKTNEEANALLAKMRQETVFQIAAQARTNAGLTLASLKQVIGQVHFQDVVAGMDRDLSRAAQARLFNAARDIASGKLTAGEELTEAVNKIEDPHLQHYFVELVYNSLQSAPTTHTVNATSNLMWNVWLQGIHRPLSAATDAILSGLTGRERQVYLREAIPNLSAIGTGLQKGLSGAKEIVKYGEVSGELQNRYGFDIKPSESSAWERSPNALLRKAAPFISMPTRLMRAADLVFNMTAMEQEARRLAIRQTIREQKTNPSLNYEQRVRELSKDPALVKQASLYARYSTFNDEPGNLTRSVATSKKALGILGPFTIPFINTGANIAKRGAELTPGLGLVAHYINSRNFAVGFKADGTPKRAPNLYRAGAAEIIAQQMEGLVIGSVLYSMFQQRDENGLPVIQGAMPTDRAHREALYRRGVLPYSVRIGNQWVQYGNVQPFSIALGMTANLYQQWQHFDQQIQDPRNAKTATDLAGENMLAYAASLKQTLLNNTWAGDIADLLDSSPTNPNNALSAAAQHFSALVPYSGLLRFAAKQALAGTTGKVPLVDPEAAPIWAALVKVAPLPLALFDAPHKLTVFGEEISLNTEGFIRSWLPLRVGEDAQDPIEDEMARLNHTVGFTYADRTFSPYRGMKEVAIPDDLYRQYTVLAGTTSKAAIAKMVNSPMYQAIPQTPRGDARRGLLLDKVAKAQIDVAQAKLKAWYWKGVRSGQYPRPVSSGLPPS